MGTKLTFLLRGASRNDNDIALPGLLVLGGSHARGRVAVVGCVAEVLDLGVADFGLGVYEQDLAGDLVVLLFSLVGDELTKRKGMRWDMG
jgi:hypothetical protein